MPNPEKMPLAHRIGPERAGAAKTTARHYYVDKGWSLRAIAARLRTDLKTNIAASTIRHWAQAGEWVQQGKSLDPRKRPTTSEKAIAEKSKSCLKRCQVCLKLIEPGETHICAIKAGRTLPIFGGTFL